MKNKRATAENVPPRAARGPYFLTKMVIKIEIFRLLTPLLFYINKHIIIHFRENLEPYNSENIDLRPKKPHFLRFFAIFSKSCIFRPCVIQMTTPPRVFDVFEWVLLQHARKGYDKKRWEPHF